MKLKLTRTAKLLCRGFTLIELLVVLVILAALAALIVPNIGMFGRSSDMAVSAKSQADIANQLSMFFVTQKRYPQGLDSLLVTGGTALYAPDVDNADQQTRGFPYAGADGLRLSNAAATGSSTVLAVGSLTNATGAEYLRSLTRAGFDWVWDHDVTVINSNTSNTNATNTGFRAMAADVAAPGVAATPGSVAAPTTFAVAEVTNATMITKLNGGPLRAGLERIVAFGFGQRNTAIGKYTTTTPLYPGADKTYYGRYIVYFKVYASGERATLVGVSDAYTRTPDYTQQQFNESLPDGGRQG